MKCPRCQHENPSAQKFCGECGARLTSACHACGASNPPGQRFCGECGASLDAPPTSRFASAQQYTPKHLAERILSSKEALEGERKQITVLFADLKGSTELIADLDPEEARTLLDPVLEKMMEAVHRHEGTVSRVMGDGIMALFGAPLALEDHAVRACYAALGMQAAIRSHSEQLRRSQGASVQIRVGLNSGEVVVRAIHSDLHMDYTAMGVTTHLAARLEQLAEPGTTLLSSATLQLAEGYVTVKAQGPVTLKGIGHLAEVYELTGPGSARTRFQAVAARGLTRLAGRSGELAQLVSALERSHAGHGQVAALVGEPGVGKSRLVWEFTHSHRTRDWLVLESASVSYGKASAYRPVIDLLKHYFQIEDRDDARRMREKITGKLFALDEAFKPHLVPLLALLDLPVEDERWKALDPVQKRLRTLDACKRLILREAQVQALVVVFEDLHWIDSETQALLEALVESLPTARVLLLVNFRPEYEHRWGPKTYYTQLRIDPLEGESAKELLRTLLGTDPSLQPLTRLLIERTEGNPLFLEESVRTLVETRALAGSRGAYRLSAPATSIQVPSTVQAILAARIDRLGPEDKQLLQAAAVIGKDVPYSLLQAVADVPEEALRQRLGRLQAAEFLYEKTLFPDLEYTFKHALTHEVAYGELLHERRRTLHAEVVEAIERTSVDRLEEHTEQLAHHALRGELWDKAFAYLQRAGTKALSRSANRDAVAYFDQALAILARQAQSAGASEQEIDIRLGLRRALQQLGALRQILGHLQAAEKTAAEIRDVRRLAKVHSQLALYYVHVGDSEKAIESGQRALATARTQDDFSTRIATQLYLGVAHYARGEYEASARDCLATVTSLEGRLAYEHLGVAGLPSVGARTWLAASLVELGKFSEAFRHSDAALHLGRAADHPYSIVHGCFAIGFTHLRRGSFPAAIPVLREALELSESRAILLFWPKVASELAAAYALAERFTESLPLLEAAVERAASMGLMFGQALRLCWLGESYLLDHRVDDATRCAKQSLDLAERWGERGQRAWALRLLGEIAASLEATDLTLAEDHYRRALSAAVELGMRPLVARCHAGLGSVCRRVAKAEQAREYFATARSMYREMGMTYWLEKVEAEVRALE